MWSGEEEMKVVFMKLERAGDGEAMAIRVDAIHGVVVNPDKLVESVLLMASGAEVCVKGTLEVVMTRVQGAFREAMSNPQIVLGE